MGDRLQDASDRDLAALQGRREQVYCEENGLLDAPDEHGGNGAITTIEGRGFTVHTAEGELLLKGTFTLNALTEPKAITWMDAIGADAGKRLPASYELSADGFAFIAADAGNPRPSVPRPSVFQTGPGQVMRAFVRRQ